MGLDMYIYKQDKGYEEAEKKCNELETSMTNKMNKHLEKHKNTIKTKLQFFILRNKEHLHDNGETERVFNKLKIDVTQYLYRSDNSDIHSLISWQLFNNCSVFEYYVDNTIKSSIVKDFIETFFSISDITFSKDRELLQEFGRERDALEYEEAYWRKYHDLNTYILTELVTVKDDGNCENLPLTKEDVIKIKEFIVKDDKEFYNDTSQIDSILNTWDDTATYVYHPWW
jgi:hypothetical protein